MTFYRHGALACAIVLAAACAGGAVDNVDWPVNGGPGNARYSSLTQITRDNVGQLQVA